MFHTFEVFFNHFLSYSCFRQIAIILIAFAGGVFLDFLVFCGLCSDNPKYSNYYDALVGNIYRACGIIYKEADLEKPRNFNYRMFAYMPPGYNRFRGLMGLCLAILLFASTVISVKYLYLGFDAITPQSVFGTLLVVFLILSAYICSRKGGL